MCELKKLNNSILVADIKYDFIVNIINQASKCEGIDRIVLFGSSAGKNCKDESDIDIAVFGNQSKNSYLKSKEFKEFHRSLFMFDSEKGQGYDILYFVSDNEYDDDIIADIEKGSTIYRRQAV